MKYDTSKQIEKEKAINYFNKLLSKKSIINITKFNPNRTISQNSYIHVIISLFAIEFGYSLEEAKTLLKRECFFMIYEKKGIKFLRKTSNMSTTELSDFIEWIINYSGKNGLNLPSSEDYKKNRVEIDNIIFKNKSQL